MKNNVQYRNNIPNNCKQSKLFQGKFQVVRNKVCLIVSRRETFRASVVLGDLR